MKQELISYLKTTAGKHVFAIALSVVAIISFRSYMAEHDARLIADQQVKAAQSQIDTLQKQQVQADKAAKIQVVRLQAKAAEVKTAPEAIAALPSVSVEQLKARALPDAPSAVSVEAVPLYQELNKCKQDAVNLGACSVKLDLQQKIDADKDVQITALKKKPGFWHRVKSTAITLGIGAAAGYVLTHR